MNSNTRQERRFLFWVWATIFFAWHVVIVAWAIHLDPSRHWGVVGAPGDILFSFCAWRLWITAKAIQRRGGEVTSVITEHVEDIHDAAAQAVERVLAPTRLGSALRRERVRRAGGRCSKNARRQRWALYGDLCWICHAPATQTDHVIAVALDGPGWPANLRPVCRRCNCSKGARHWREIAPKAKGLPTPRRLP